MFGCHTWHCRCDCFSLCKLLFIDITPLDGQGLQEQHRSNDATCQGNSICNFSVIQSLMSVYHPTCTGTSSILAEFPALARSVDTAEEAAATLCNRHWGGEEAAEVDMGFVVLCRRWGTHCNVATIIQVRIFECASIHKMIMWNSATNLCMYIKHASQKGRPRFSCWPSPGLYPPLPKWPGKRDNEMS